jgi:hypothetical protein
VPDARDNCPNTANHGQADADGDGKGDACDGTAPNDPGPTNPGPTDPGSTDPGPPGRLVGRNNSASGPQADRWQHFLGESSIAAPPPGEASGLGLGEGRGLAAPAHLLAVFTNVGENWNSRKFAVASNLSDTVTSTPKLRGATTSASKRGEYVPFVAPLCIKGLQVVTVQLPEKSLFI